MVQVLTKESLRVVGGGLGGGGDDNTRSGAIGAGIGGAAVIDAAGGMGALAASSPAIAMGAAAATATGIGATLSVSFEAGSWLYNNNETVRGVAGQAVENVMENGFWKSVGDGFLQAWDTIVEFNNRSPYMCYP
jgi:hypothetical protein